MEHTVIILGREDEIVLAILLYYIVVPHLLSLIHISDLDKEAVRVVKSMPSWIPAKQNGKAVKSRYTLPVYILSLIHIFIPTSIMPMTSSFL